MSDSHDQDFSRITFFSMYLPSSNSKSISFWGKKNVVFMLLGVIEAWPLSPCAEVLSRTTEAVVEDRQGLEALVIHRGESVATNTTSETLAFFFSVLEQGGDVFLNAPE